MQLNDATRIIDVIDQRIAKHTASNARVETTWGTVAAVSADGRYADLYLYGQSAPYTSDYFRLPSGLAVNVGNSVKAAIDKERGDRWIEEVHAFPAYNRVEFDIVDGEVRLGGGTGATDVRLYRTGTKTLTIDDGAGGNATVNVVGTIQQGGSPVALASQVPGASGTVTSETGFGQSATAGVASTYSKGDHSHGTPSLASTAPTTQAIGDAASVGSGTTAAKADHLHGMPGFAGPSAIGLSGATGSSPSVNRGDHVHGIPDGLITTAKLAAATKRWRYVPLASMSTVLNGASGASATVVELTAIPANTAIAVEVTIGVRESSGANVSISVYHYNGGVQGAAAGITYTSGVAARGGFSSAGPVLVGGTNGRQIVWATSVTGAAVNAYLYVHGYWVLED